MNLLFRLAGLLLLLALARYTTSCASPYHAAQAPRLARRHYHHAERRNARHRRHLAPPRIQWN